MFDKKDIEYSTRPIFLTSIISRQLPPADRVRLKNGVNEVATVLSQAAVGVMDLINRHTLEQCEGYNTHLQTRNQAGTFPVHSSALVAAYIPEVTQTFVSQCFSLLNSSGSRVQADGALINIATNLFTRARVNLQGLSQMFGPLALQLVTNMKNAWFHFFTKQLATLKAEIGPWEKDQDDSAGFDFGNAWTPSLIQRYINDPDYLVKNGWTQLQIDGICWEIQKLVADHRHVLAADGQVVNTGKYPYNSITCLLLTFFASRSPSQSGSLRIRAMPFGIAVICCMSENHPAQNCSRFTLNEN